MADKKYNPYDNMLSVLKQSAEALGLSYEDYATLCYPERELKVSIPIRMDGQRNVTVSTCGIVPRMRELADKKLQITLALSLHAP